MGMLSVNAHQRLVTKVWEPQNPLVTNIKELTSQTESVQSPRQHPDYMYHIVFTQTC